MRDCGTLAALGASQHPHPPDTPCRAVIARLAQRPIRFTSRSPLGCDGSGKFTPHHFPRRALVVPH
jgi:hypothetical protein